MDINSIWGYLITRPKMLKHLSSKPDRIKTLFLNGYGSIREHLEEHTTLIVKNRISMNSQKQK